MNIELIAQHFNDQEIRFVKHPEDKYEFGIVADDLAAVLEASSGKDIARSVKEVWKGAHNVLTHGGTQSMIVIWEPGIYHLLSVSRKPKAEPFQEWVFEEVLPSIRKTGSYSTQSLSPGELLKLQAEAIISVEQKQKEQALQLEQQNNRLAAIETRFEKADEKLKALPAATETVPIKSIRSSLNELLRSYAYRTGEDYRELWRNLYKEYRYRHHVDLVARAKNQNMKVLEYAEEVNVIDKLYAVAILLYNSEL